MEPEKIENSMIKVIYEMCGLWVTELMHPAEYELFCLTKSDFIRIRHTERI